MMSDGDTEEAIELMENSADDSDAFEKTAILIGHYINERNFDEAELLEVVAVLVETAAVRRRKLENPRAGYASSLRRNSGSSRFARSRTHWARVKMR